MKTTYSFRGFNSACNDVFNVFLQRILILKEIRQIFEIEYQG